jgi:transposase
MECFVGIDAWNATLDIASLPDAERWIVPNDDAGLAARLPPPVALHPTLVVLEATGGFESAAVSTLAKVGLPVVVVNPRQVRDLAKSMPTSWTCSTTGCGPWCGPCPTRPLSISRPC